MVYHWQTDTAVYDFLHKVKVEQLSAYITAYGYYPTTDFEEILNQCQDLDSVILDAKVTVLDHHKDSLKFLTKGQTTALRLKGGGFYVG